MSSEDFVIYDGSGTQQSPCAEWNGSVNLYLIAWEDYSDGNIYAQRVQKALPHLVGSRITVSTSGDYLKVPDIASDNTNWFVVYEYYQGGSNPSWAIYGRLVKNDGTLGTEQNISYSGGTNARKYNPRVAYNSGSSSYLVVYKDEAVLPYRIKGRRVATNGTVLGDTFTIISSTSYDYMIPAVGSNGTNFLVVAWNEDTRNVEGRIVSGNGVPQGSVFTIGYGGYYGDSDVSSNGTNFLVVWNDGSSVKGRIYDNNGNPVTSEITIATGTSGVYLLHPKVDWYAGISKYQIVWYDNRRGIYHIFGRKMNPDGSFSANDTIEKMTWDDTLQVLPDVACGDTNLVTWQDYRKEDNDPSTPDIYANLGKGSLGEEDTFTRPKDPSGEPEKFSLIYFSSFFNEKITLKFSSCSENPLKIIIYNVSGIPIYENFYPMTPYTLTLSDKRILNLKKGTYFLSAYSKNKEIGKIKLIKR
ncbi:MAG: hypothetical protein ABIM62_05605 [candidate division WOR-3 bacterium]